MPFFTSEWLWSVHWHAPLNILTGVIGQDGYVGAVTNPVQNGRERRWRRWINGAAFCLDQFVHFFCAENSSRNRFLFYHRYVDCARVPHGNRILN